MVARAGTRARGHPPLAGKSLAEITAALDTANYYVNIHTLRNRAGEIRGQVAMDD